MNCSMANDLIRLAWILETVLQRMLPKFKPRFTLVGSMAEGTRVGLANELDISLSFDAWEENRPNNVPFRVKQNDPFSLQRTAGAPSYMAGFFGTSGDFKFHKFKQ